MDRTTLETLEFPAVLEELVSFTVTPEGRERAYRLGPLSSIVEMEEVRAEFAEVQLIIKEQGRLPLGGVADLRPLFARIDPEGSFLMPEEILQVCANLDSSLRLRALLDPQFEKTFPVVFTRIEPVSNQRALLSELQRVMDEKGEIKDSASPALNGIRREIRTSKARARKIIDGLAAVEKDFEETLQEDYVTIRDDRYVISIKAGMQGRLDGIIHGRSNSGATYFVEPFQLVELNNRIAILRKEERAEEIEILKNATAYINSVRPGLLKDQSIMAGLDLAQAKALFAAELEGVMPEVKAEGSVNLKSARHPLLILKEKRGGAGVVPVDITIPEGCRVLVISGVNTGGKTVALKTLGLLSLMCLSGIPVPVEEGSVAVAYNAIFSDIGDRQDIIASLSTFSAHIKRIGEFLKNAGKGSLVLIDEIGAGTDPSEGSAFGFAALETFREAGATTVITTHLNMLKARAQADPGYLNASVEFDETTLKPLYKLMYGVPGPSLGLSIAQSLGIPASLIEKARNSLSDKEGAFIESVRLLEEEREEVRRLKDRLYVLESRREEALRKLREKREAIVEKARAKVDAAVEKARKDIRETVSKLREEKVSVRQASQRTLASVEGIGKRALGPAVEKRSFYRPAQGDKVAIAGSNTKGVVVKVDEAGKKAEVQVGALKVWAPWERLLKRGPQASKAEAAQGFFINADMEITGSVNVIGSTVEDALPVITKFLDSAHSAGKSTVEIIHGIGTGRLAKGIEEYLKKNPLVKSFHRGAQAQGGAGVTVVELA